MIPKQGMTIQEYFSRFGIGDAVRSNRLADVPIQGGDNGQFNLLLDRLQEDETSDDQNVSRGLCITDYLAHRVRSSLSRMICDRKIQHQFGQSAKSIAPPVPLSTAQLPASYPEKVASEQQSPPAAQPTDINRKIELTAQKAATKYNLPIGLIRSVIRAESNFRPDAVSPAGAQGLMQLMPATAEELGVENPFNIEENVDGGARYLRQMLDMFDNDIEKALAAYNAGPGTVAKFNGNVPYRETQNYVQKVLAYSKQQGLTKVTT